MIAMLREWIGLKDKNGQKILTGAILKVDGTRIYERCRPKPRKGQFVGVFKVEKVLGQWGYEYNWEPISGYGCSTHIMEDMKDDLTIPNVEIL